MIRQGLLLGRDEKYCCQEENPPQMSSQSRFKSMCSLRVFYLKRGFDRF